jgi:hypothetical protein
VGRTHLQEGRNTIRFLLPPKATTNMYFDRELLILARAVYLAMEWRKTDPVYGDLQKTFQTALTDKLKGRFDRFAVLDIWNFAEPAKCRFGGQSHGAQGNKIPDAVDAIIKKVVLIPEDFDEYVLLLADSSESVGKLLKDLREPRPNGKQCIPWLGEVEVKERVIKLCAEGRIAINVRGLEMLQAKPGESSDDAWHRMKSRLGTGKHLDETTMQNPDAVVTSAGKIPVVTVPPPGDGPGTCVGATGVTTAYGSATNPDTPDSGAIPAGEFVPSSLFGGVTGTGAGPPSKLPLSARPTSGLNLLGQIETWGIGPATRVTNVSVKANKMTKIQLEAFLKLFAEGVTSLSVSVQSMTGAQLQQLLKHLPDGVTYGLDLEKEAK